MDKDFIVSILLRAIGAGETTKGLDSVTAGAERVRTALSSNAWEQARLGIDSLSHSVEGLTAPFTTAATVAGGLAAAITAVGAALAAGAYSDSKEYESAIADLSKVMAGGQAEALDYGEQLDRLALQYGANGEKLVAAMANFVQAGFSSAESFDLVEQSIKQMIAWEMEAGPASETLISILKGFKAPASEAAAAIDLINKVSDAYATDAKQLATAMAIISPVAEKMGFTMAETAALATPIIEVFRSGSEAGEAMKTGMLKVIDSGSTTIDVLTKLNVAQKNTDGSLRQGKAVYNDVANAISALTKEEQLFYVGQLIGIDQAAKMSEALSNQAKTAEVLAVGLNATGSVTAEVTKRLQTAETAANRSDEAWRQLSTTIGNQYRDQVKGVVGATAALTSAFDQAIKDGGIEPLLLALRPQIKTVEDLFSAMASNVQGAFKRLDFGPLARGINDVSAELGNAITNLMAGLDLETESGLTEFLQRAINLLGNFATFVGGIIDGLRPLTATLGEVFKWLMQNREQLRELNGQFIGTLTSINLMLPVIAKLASTLFDIVGTVVEVIAVFGLLSGALTVFSRVTGIQAVASLNALTMAFFRLSPATAGALAIIAGFPGAIPGLLIASGAAGAALTTWSGAGEGLGKTLSDIGAALFLHEEDVTRASTADEIAAARTRRLTAEKENLLQATRDLSNAPLTKDEVASFEKKLADAIPGLIKQVKELQLEYDTLGQGSDTKGAEEALGRLKKAQDELRDSEEQLANARKRRQQFDRDEAAKAAFAQEQAILNGIPRLRAAVDKAQAEFDRLSDSGNISEQIQATANLQKAKADLAEAEENLRQAQARRLAVGENALQNETEEAAKSRELIEYWKALGYQYDIATGALSRLDAAQGKAADTLEALKQEANKAKDALSGVRSAAEALDKARTAADIKNRDPLLVAEQAALAAATEESAGRQAQALKQVEKAYDALKVAMDSGKAGQQATIDALDARLRDISMRLAQAVKRAPGLDEAGQKEVDKEITRLNTTADKVDRLGALPAPSTGGVTGTAQAEALKKSYMDAGMSAAQAEAAVAAFQKRAGATDMAPIEQPVDGAKAANAVRIAVDSAFKKPISIELDATAAASSVVEQVHSALNAAKFTVSVTALVTEVTAGGGTGDIGVAADKTGGVQG